ncbi:MAG: DUF465 domain-containing protein [Alphaproteobacteria bacterium CG_4_9_14_3_um_filter_47_13]|nr:MAG: DUF465 domain-containing protein [Alphaproteobacteria bacterium CG_4_9_14_3_um_filter_47_13]
MQQPQKSFSSTHTGHLEALRARHASLEAKIYEEQKRPAGSGETLRRLKLKKLKLKEQITEKET